MANAKSRVRKRGLLTDLGLRALGVGETVTDPAARGSGVLQAKKLKAGSIAFYFRYTRPDGTRDRLRLPVGISLTEARAHVRALSSQYQAGSGDVREDRAKELRATQLEDEVAKRREEENRAKRHATLGALLDAYAGELLSFGKPSANSVRRALHRHVREPWPSLWEKPASDVSSDELVAIVSRVFERGHAREAGKLQSYLQSAYRAGNQARFDPRRSPELRALQVRNNPAADLMAGPGIGTKERTLSAHELRAYWRRIAEAPGVDAALLRVHLLTGAQRLIQLGRVTTSDYDTDLSAIIIRDGKGRRANARLHVVPLIPEAASALAAIENRLGPFLISVTGGKSGITDHTFGSRLRTVVDAMIEAGELQSGPFTSGDLRRTVESRLAGAKIPKHVRAHLHSHGLGGVQDRHYDRHSYFAEKLHALETLRELIQGDSI